MKILYYAVIGGRSPIAGMEISEACIPFACPSRVILLTNSHDYLCFRFFVA